LSVASKFSIFLTLESSPFISTYIETAIITDITTTGKPRFVINALKESPAYDPIIIFGGSPISVAVPQRLEAIIIGITNLTGLISNIFAIDIATGTIRKIVVTLSKKADNTAVIKKNEKNSITIFPLEYSKSFTASHSNTRVCDSTHTIIIIDTNRAITSPSILENACCRLKNCSSGIKCPNV
jgi:hypothetical protein